jgi:hypothetical protein
MVHLGEAIARYHELFDGPGYRDLAWAEAFQERMRDERLTESGRLLAPVLRPQFLSRKQLDRLTDAAERILSIAGQVAELALSSPALLSRLRLLPAEKMLAADAPGGSGFPVLSRVEALAENGSVSVLGLDGCNPAALACSDRIADLFLDLPIVKEFERGKYRLSKPGGSTGLQAAVQEGGKKFGVRSKPRIAIVRPEGDSAESDAARQLLVSTGNSTRLASPDELTYEGRTLRAGDFAIDVALRCVSIRDLLIRFGLSHPLFAASRDGAVCLVNDFRSEITRRRALLELLTDDSVAVRLTAADRKLVQAVIPWTRVVSRRKTAYQDRQVDLLDFVVANREKLVLRPNEDIAGEAVFTGAAMTQPAWERAIRTALQSPYVVQESARRSREPFPVYQYGEFQMRDVEVSVHPNLFNGRVHGASAALQMPSPSGSSFVGAAPVLLLETLKN